MTEYGIVGFVVMQPRPRAKPTALKRSAHGILLSKRPFRERERQRLVRPFDGSPRSRRFSHSEFYNEQLRVVRKAHVPWRTV